MKNSPMKNGILLSLAAFFLTAGCSNLFHKPDKATNLVPVSIRLNLSAEAQDENEAARTLMPNPAGAAGLWYSLKFAKGETVREDTIDSGLAKTVSLELGTWDLLVYGYHSAADRETGPAKAVLGGSAAFTIQQGSPAAVTVDLAAAAGGTENGTFRYEITFPQTVSYGTLIISDPNGGSPRNRDLLAAGADNTVSVSGSSATAAGSFADLPAGYYRLGLELYDHTSSAIARKSEILHIYGGMESGAGYVFTPANFAAGPINVPYNTSLPVTLANILAGPAGEYTVILPADESCPPMNLAAAGTKEFVITLRGNGHTVDLNDAGALFTVGGSGVSWKVSLALQDIALEGITGNNSPLVRVEETGRLILNNGAVIRNNENTVSYDSGGVYLPNSRRGGGVWVAGGTLTMNGGEISGNTALYYGGGVFVTGNGTLTMSGGTISGNTAFEGGGVFVTGNGTLTMSGGEISGNTADSGGGVYSQGNAVTMSGGEISGNTADVYGGGVYLRDGSFFIMSGGEISDNTAVDYGGGVCAFVNVTFTMNDGEISGNIARYGGGIAYMYSGASFTMNGGKISGNTASAASAAGEGGGVLVGPQSAFTMNDGEISGNSARYGGGVNLYGVDNTMTGGEISGNSARDGGGVFLEYFSAFTMSGGKISNNTAESSGGGVVVTLRETTFTMSGGEISGNTATYGGGVLVSAGDLGGSNSEYAGTFTMSGGARVIPGPGSDNNIYLTFPYPFPVPKQSTLTIGGDFTGPPGPVARIELYCYDPNSKLIGMDILSTSPPGGSIDQSVIDRFSLDRRRDDGAWSPLTDYKIGADGKLALK